MGRARVEGKVVYGRRVDVFLYIMYIIHVCTVCGWAIQCIHMYIHMYMYIEYHSIGSWLTLFLYLL